MPVPREFTVSRVKGGLQPFDGQEAGKDVQTHSSVSLGKHSHSSQEFFVAQAPMNRGKRLFARKALCHLGKIRILKGYEAQQACAIA